MSSKPSIIAYAGDCPRCGYTVRFTIRAERNTVVGDCDLCGATLAHIVTSPDDGQNFEIRREVIDVPADDLTPAS